MRASRQLVIGLIVLAVIFVGLAAFYFTQKTNFLAAGRPAHHWKHGVVFSVLALLSLVAANFARPKPARL